MRYLFHHPGLGDNIIFNGLVREVIKDSIPTTLFSKHMYYDFVKEMYKDIDDKLLIILGIDNVHDVRDVSRIISGQPDVILTGLLGAGWPGTDSHFDETCYKQAKIDYNKKWESFKYERNIDAEMELFKKYNVKEKNYIFVHDDCSRNFIINKHLPTHLKIVTPEINYTSNIFNYRYLIENAAEVHCIDSCFRCMIENFDINENLYYHQYARHPQELFIGYSGWNTPFSRKNWKVYI